ncbi:MAG: hypothetical protein NC412_07390 [Roseburia sp.]|nr:hypothetical protein [Roseburia sp.]MCM1278560.1 hypothetical protein [Robinsoniella sp.]
MKMKLVICTKDNQYAARFMNYFDVHYADRMELIQFTDAVLLGQYISREHLDICLMDKEMLKALEAVMKEHATIVVLTEDRDEEAGAYPCIYKYQKAEMIFKELLNIYADGKSGLKSFRKRSSNEARSYVFCSASGGAGATTVALAYAIRQAREKSVLYLNLQQYSNADLILKGEGTGKFDDVIFALKSKRGALSLKLESLVRKSKENVNFFVSCDNPLDLQELTVEEIEKLLKEVISCGLYQEVIIDIDSKLSPLEIAVMEQVEHIILVEGGTVSNSMKFGKFYRALEAVEDKMRKAFLSKLLLFYNQFSNKTSIEIEKNLAHVIGGIPRFEGVNMEGIISRIVMMDVFDQLRDLENEER